MVAFSGNGIIDTLTKPFTANKYGNEKHALSLDKNHFLQPMSFMGPFTEVALRDKIGDNKPINDLDKFAETHDRAYLKELNEFKKDHDKQKHINNIWDADKKFVNEANHSHDDPIMGKIAGKLIDTKMKLEKNHILPTTEFSGFGNNEEETITDPTLRLKQLVNDELRLTNKRKKHVKVQDAGFAIAPLVPFLAPIAGSLLNDLYTFVKKKVSGGNIRLSHIKNNTDKKHFLINVMY